MVWRSKTPFLWKRWGFSFVGFPLFTLAGDLDREEDVMNQSIQKLSPEKQAAYNRLKADFSTIIRNAKRTGKTVENYLLDLGIDKEVVQVMGREAQAAQQKEAEKAGIPPGPLTLSATPPDPQPDIKVNLDRIIFSDDMKKIITDLTQKMATIAEMQTHRKIASPLSKSSFLNAIFQKLNAMESVIKLFCLIVITVATVWVFVLFLKGNMHGRYEMSSGTQNMSGIPGVYRLDTRSGEVKLFVYDIQSQEMIEIKEWLEKR